MRVQALQLNVFNKDQVTRKPTRLSGSADLLDSSVANSSPRVTSRFTPTILSSRLIHRSLRHYFVIGCAHRRLCPRDRLSAQTGVDLRVQNWMTGQTYSAFGGLSNLVNMNPLPRPGKWTLRSKLRSTPIAVSRAKPGVTVHADSLATRLSRRFIVG